MALLTAVSGSVCAMERQIDPDTLFAAMRPDVFHESLRNRGSVWLEQLLENSPSKKIPQIKKDAADYAIRSHLFGILTCLYVNKNKNYYPSATISSVILKKISHHHKHIPNPGVYQYNDIPDPVVNFFFNENNVERSYVAQLVNNFFSDPYLQNLETQIRNLKKIYTAEKLMDLICNVYMQQADPKFWIDILSMRIDALKDTSSTGHNDKSFNKELINLLFNKKLVKPFNNIELLDNLNALDKLKLLDEIENKRFMIPLLSEYILDIVQREDGMAMSMFSFINFPKKYFEYIIEYYTRGMENSKKEEEEDRLFKLFVRYFVEKSSPNAPTFSRHIRKRVVINHSDSNKNFNNFTDNQSTDTKSYPLISPCDLALIIMSKIPISKKWLDSSEDLKKYFDNHGIALDHFIKVLKFSKCTDQNGLTTGFNSFARYLMDLFLNSDVSQKGRGVSFDTMKDFLTNEKICCNPKELLGHDMFLKIKDKLEERESSKIMPQKVMDVDRVEIMDTKSVGYDKGEGNLGKRSILETNLPDLEQLRQRMEREDDQEVLEKMFQRYIYLDNEEKSKIEQEEVNRAMQYLESGFSENFSRYDQNEIDTTVEKYDDMHFKPRSKEEKAKLNEEELKEEELKESKLREAQLYFNTEPFKYPTSNEANKGLSVVQEFKGELKKISKNEEMDEADRARHN